MGRKENATAELQRNLILDSDQADNAISPRLDLSIHSLLGVGDKWIFFDNDNFSIIFLKGAHPCTSSSEQGGGKRMLEDFF